MQKVLKYFKVLKKYFKSFHSAIVLLSKVGSPISKAIAKPLYTSEGFLISSGEKIKVINECLKEVEDKISENWDVTNMFLNKPKKMQKVLKYFK
ncbi:31647_t:CDS:2, partial [Gigaspora margarita]